MHKLMKPAKLAYHTMSGAQVEVISVCEYDLHPESAKLFGRQGFDSGLRPHWDKGRCLDTTMGRVYLSKSSTGFC